jgi:HSP20 family protein
MEEHTMAIVRQRGATLSPWSELDDFDRLFDRFLGRGGTSVSQWMPAVNVSENQDELVMTAELPGMTEADIEIEFENSVLTIRGEKKEEREEAGDDLRYHVWERRYGSFQRSFTLPRTVKADDIAAEFNNGILTIHMPKVPEAKSRRISVKTSA